MDWWCWWWWCWWWRKDVGELLGRRENWFGECGEHKKVCEVLEGGHGLFGVGCCEPVCILEVSTDSFLDLSIPFRQPADQSCAGELCTADTKCVGGRMMLLEKLNPCLFLWTHHCAASWSYLWPKLRDLTNRRWIICFIKSEAASSTAAQLCHTLHIAWKLLVQK